MITSQTVVTKPPLAPELRFYGATDYAALWGATEAALQALALPPPFWAFAWPGGQALARFLLDRPALARGRRVWALGAGAGLEAIAAARAGAAAATANDVDPFALSAARLNAGLNGARLALDGTDRLAPGAAPPEADVVLIADAYYEADLSRRIDALLDRLAAAAAPPDIWIAGPDRPHPSARAAETVAVYDVPVPRALEDVDRRVTRVARLRV